MSFPSARENAAIDLYLFHRRNHSIRHGLANSTTYTHALVPRDPFLYNCAPRTSLAGWEKHLNNAERASDFNPFKSVYFLLQLPQNNLLTALMRALPPIYIKIYLGHKGTSAETKNSIMLRFQNRVGGEKSGGDGAKPGPPSARA